MAIKPIKGFYVHDETTGTDGVAKVAYDAISDAPDRKWLLFKSASFDLSLVAFDENGFLYRKSNLPTTHQNYIWLKNERPNPTSLKLTFNMTTYSDIMRYAIKFSNGEYIYIAAVADSKQKWVLSIYDKNTNEIGTKTVVNTLDCTLGEHIFDLINVGFYYYVYIDGVLWQYVKLSTGQEIASFGVSFRGSLGNSYYKDFELGYSERFIHFSLDDQLEFLQDITQNRNTYTSIFDNDLLATLKELHEEYGCVFTLMLFNSNDATNPTFSLSDVVAKASFREEFINSSHWLKFAYHGPDPTTLPASDMTAAQLVASVNDVYTQIGRFATKANIDVVPRLTFFNCTKEQALALRSNNLVRGFLTADDTRAVNVGLDDSERAIVNSVEIYKDIVNDISYFTTAPRLDVSSYPEDNIIVDKMNARLNHLGRDKVFIVFAHSITSERMKARFKTVAEWARKNGFHFDFSMNHI